LPHWKAADAAAYCEGEALANARRGPGGPGRNRSAALISLRQLHSYIGAFIAPSVLFFAATGALQLFSLHEAHGGYRPPPWVMGLSRIHKDQAIAPPPARAAEPGGGHEHHDHGARAESPRATPWSVTALKWTFLAVAAGLILSTLIGLWLGFTASRRKGVILALFVLGAALPVALLAMQP
jgi:ABC-type sugar transport system permease subunit